MEIKKERNQDTLTVSLNGRLDTMTSPQLESDLDDLDGVLHLIFDFDDLEYISSAGLRLLLKLDEILSDHNGDMRVIHVHPLVKEIFDITGFCDMLQIEAE
jgi:anti-sigma B factor antagonist